MKNYAERFVLLSEMIAFSIIDGKLHKREFHFLEMIAQELKVNKSDFINLFHKEDYPVVIKSELARVQQFYRLALLMHCDGVLHEREQIKIHEIGINMGLNPHAIKRILRAMELSPTKIISPEFLLKVFREQLN